MNDLDRAEIGRFLYPLLTFRWGFSPREISGNAVRLKHLAEVVVVTEFKKSRADIDTGPAADAFIPYYLYLQGNRLIPLFLPLKFKVPGSGRWILPRS